MYSAVCCSTVHSGGDVEFTRREAVDAQIKRTWHEHRVTYSSAIKMSEVVALSATYTAVTERHCYMKYVRLRKKKKLIFLFC